jgi:flagellar protein FlaG
MNRFNRNLKREELIMSIQMTASVHRQESVLAAQSNRMRTVEQKIDALKNFAASLPGSHENGSEDAPRDINAISEELEQISFAINKKLRFFVDHETHEVIVKVIDPETDKVVKILPPEELRRIHHKIKKTIGVLFDELI